MRIVPLRVRRGGGEKLIELELLVLDDEAEEEEEKQEEEATNNVKARNCAMDDDVADERAVGDAAGAEVTAIMVESDAGSRDVRAVVQAVALRPHSTGPRHPSISALVSTRLQSTVVLSRMACTCCLCCISSFRFCCCCCSASVMFSISIFSCLLFSFSCCCSIFSCESVAMRSTIESPGM